MVVSKITELTLKQWRELSIKNASESLYLIAVFMYAFIFVLSRTTFDTQFVDFVSLVAQISILILLVIRIIALNEQIGVVLIEALVVFLLAYSWMICGNATLLWCALLVIGSRNIPFETISRVVFSGLLIALLIVVASLVIGFTSNEVVVRESAEGIIARHSFGFSHPNIFGGVLVALVLSWVGFRFEKIGILDYFSGALICVVCYFGANSYSSLYVIILAMIVCFFSRQGKKNAAIVKKPGIAILAVVCIVFSLFMMYCYDPNNPIEAAINASMSGRLNYAHYYTEMSSFNLLGQNWSDIISLSTVGHDGIVVDNAFSHTILVQGFAAFCIAVTIIVLSSSFALTSDISTPIAIACCCVLCYALMETMAFDYVLFYCFGCLFWRVRFMHSA